MDEDDSRKATRSHEVGMLIDQMGVEELQERIGLLQDEIARLTAAIAARKATRSNADALFKF